MLSTRVKIYLCVFILVVWVPIAFKKLFAAEITDMPVYDLEQAWRVKLVSGATFMCLPTGEGFGFTDQVEHSTQVALTCAATGDEPLVWRFCIGGPEMLSCVPPGTRMQGVTDDSVEVRPDVRLGMTLIYPPE